MVSSPIMKLDIDCFHEVFDYLCLDDLISMGHTCKRLQRVTGSFVKQNFAAKRKTCVNNNIYMCWMPRQVGIFNQFIDKISIFGGFSNPFQYINLNIFQSLREIRLAQVELNGFVIECFNDVSPGIERVEIDHCGFNQELYADFLKLFPKLKSLSVSRSCYGRDEATIIGTGNKWMLQKYSMLKHLELTDLYEFKKDELNILFKQNPCVCSFSTDAKSLLINKRSFLSSSAELERLAIEFHPRNINSDVEPSFVVDLIFNLLVELHDKGFYRSLHLYITFVDRDNCLHKLFSLKPLEMIGGFVTSINNPIMKLKELDINNGSDITDLDELPNKVPMLERIHFSEASAHDILPFIQKSSKLQIMKIDSLIDGIHLQNGILDLVALNKERTDLKKTRKLTIYVNERVFLATKWATIDMNLNLIELRRGESFECKKLNSKHNFVKSF